MSSKNLLRSSGAFVCTLLALVVVGPPSTAQARPAADSAAAVEQGGGGAFDRRAASVALAKAAHAAASCREDGEGPRGRAPVKVTFAPEGKVKETMVVAPFAGTSTGACIISIMNRVTIEPYMGGEETLTISVLVN